MAKLKQTERFYKMYAHQTGLGFVVVEFSDKGCTKKTGWVSRNFSSEEFKQTIIRLRKERLNFEPPPVTCLDWRGISNERYERLKRKGERP